MAASKSAKRSPWLMVGGVALVAVVVVGGALLMQPTPVTVTLDPISKQTIAEEETLTVTAVAQVQGAPAAGLTFGIVSGPSGAAIDRKTGVFTWKPSEEQGPQTHKVELAVKSTGQQKKQSKQKFSIVVTEVNEPPVILGVGEQAVAAGETLKFLIRASDPDEPAQPLEFRFGPSVPAGARLDPESGSFEWTAPESSTDHAASVDVVVVEKSDKSPLQSKLEFKIHVTALTSAAVRLAAALQEAGLAIDKVGADIPPGFNGSAKGYDIAGQALDMIEYETQAAAEADLKQISQDGRTLFGQPAKWSKKTRIYHSQQLIVIWPGTDAKIQQALEQRLGAPAIIAEADASEPLPTVATAKPAAGLSELEELGKALAGLHKEKKLLNKKEYPAIRKLFADQFARQNAATLQPIYEGDGAALKKWFDTHPADLEQFYTAIVPQDDLAKALSILIELHKKFPRQFDDYFALALATAVTWDKEAGVFEYGHQAKRTHSLYPADVLGAAENFQFFIDAEKVMQGRAQYVPWEFLTHMVNHRTPRAEREWALQNYGGKRVGFGKCYAEVPYDFQMLKTESKVCKLDGKPYTLPNLRSLGGVCAQQADFAARVGKSIGVPAEYVTGAGRYGGLHAWVMWVELKQVTKTGIVFSLESHGRYFDDNYYVGNIPDPQTGNSITDRELELRLHAVGMDTVAYRQTNLIMSAYPLLRETLEWKANDEIIFLNDVIEMCPGNELAWQTVARLARDGKIETASFRLMNAMFEKLFRTFANFPDFTWKVFDDLVSFQKNVKQRNKYFERLVQLYEAAGRPDLSCEARILLSDYLLEDGKTKEVLAGLAYTIKKFPEEGQFVPKLLDKLEVVADGIKGSQPQVLQLYQELLPLIPQRRGDSPSDFHMQMLKRASDRFKSAGQVQQAQNFDAQLAKLRATK